jgi:hypothetical protein
MTQKCELSALVDAQVAAYNDHDIERFEVVPETRTGS